VYVQRTTEAVHISRLLQSRVRELLILETAGPLRRGRRYSIAFSEYHGVLGDDLRGLYRSKYRDRHGQQRCVQSLVCVCDGVAESRTVTERGTASSLLAAKTYCFKIRFSVYLNYPF